MLINFVNWFLHINLLHSQVFMSENDTKEKPNVVT